MSGDEEWDWASCDSLDDTVSVSRSTRAGRPKRVGVQVAAKVERAVAQIERTADALVKVEAECAKWRQVTAALAVVQLLSLLPGAVKEYVRDALSRCAGWLAATVSKHGLRTAVLLVLGRLIVACATKLLQRQGLLPAEGEGGVAARSAATVTVTLPPAPAAAGQQVTAAPAPAPTPAPPEDTTNDGPLSPSVQKLIRVATTTSWDPVANVKDRAWSAANVEWNGGHKITRFQAELKCSAKHFVRQVVELAPKAQRESDPMMENYRVLHETKEGPHGGYRQVYLSFKTPVWGIQQRDICVRATKAFLSPEEALKIGQINAVDDQPALNDRYDIEVDTIRNTLVVAFQSDVHPDAPEYKSYVRAHSNVNGYILTPTGDHTCRVTEVIALDIKGSLPTWAVEVGAKRIYERFHKLTDYLEGSYRQ